MDEAGSSCFALAYDMPMMVNNVNGRECIAGQHRALFPAARFELLGQRSLLLGYSHSDGAGYLIKEVREQDGNLYWTHAPYRRIRPRRR